MLEGLQKNLTYTIDIFGLILYIAFVCGAILLVSVYFIDKYQTKQTIRRNYPVIGRFRYLFEHLGEFFRQYFFAQDREELPFNRAQRSWIYRSAKDIKNVSAFGSTRDIRAAGSFYFVPASFPTLNEDNTKVEQLTIGPGCENPYTTDKIFHISGMSYGALSSVAITALSNGAKKAGVWLNTGEGGLSPYHLSGACDLVFQIGSAKYGVRDSEGNLDIVKLEELGRNENIKMFEIKLSQGAKPGKGGMLPGNKVDAEVANIRGINVGEDSFSPNRHKEIKSPHDILTMINQIRKITKKPVGIKFVVGTFDWLHTLCKEITEKGDQHAPDFITVDGAEGGTGAAPMSLLDTMGMPIRESLPLTVDIIRKYGLSGRIKVIAGGKLITSADVAWALGAGADFVVSGRGFLFALGCIQAMQCNKNTCPTGITTHKKELMHGLNPADKSVRVANYATNMHHELETIAHSCGVTDVRKLNRQHIRIMTETLRSVGMHEVYPETNIN